MTPAEGGSQGASADIARRLREGEMFFRWARLRHVYGVSLRRFAESEGLPVGTVLSWARRHEWEAAFEILEPLALAIEHERGLPKGPRDPRFEVAAVVTSSTAG